MREIYEWQRCKSRMEYAFGGSGYEQFLTDATNDTKNTQMNQVVYSLSAVWTVEETAHDLNKIYKNNNNGYGSWNNFCEWYNEDSLKNKTEDSLRSKLEIYHLTSVSNAAQYINNSLTSFQ